MGSENMRSPKWWGSVRTNCGNSPAGLRIPIYVYTFVHLPSTEAPEKAQKTFQATMPQSTIVRLHWPLIGASLRLVAWTDHKRQIWTLWPPSYLHSEKGAKGDNRHRRLWRAMKWVRSAEIREGVRWTFSSCSSLQ